MTRNPPHVVIGVTGPSGAGKSTVARALRERAYFRRNGMPVAVCKFAAPIRDALAVLGIEKGDGPGEVAHPHFRDAAQFVGAFCRNQIDLSFWVDIQRHRIASLSSPTVVVFDDVRYANECGLCDMIVRLETTRGTGLTGDQKAHESEAGWDKLPYDIAFANNHPADIEGIVDVIEGRIKTLLESEAA